MAAACALGDTKRGCRRETMTRRDRAVRCVDREAPAIGEGRRSRSHDLVNGIAEGVDDRACGAGRLGDQTDVDRTFVIDRRQRGGPARRALRQAIDMGRGRGHARIRNGAAVA